VQQVRPFLTSRLTLAKVQGVSALPARVQFGEPTSWMKKPIDKLSPSRLAVLRCTLDAGCLVWNEIGRITR
jgi:hypothetical protein